VSRPALRHLLQREPGKALAAAFTLLVAAGLFCGCDATSRHKVLTYFFDGVPPLQEPGAAAAAGPAGTPSLLPARPISFQEHGPYAAKMCGACHNEAAGNTLVAPPDQLCVRCHALKLDKPYIHGPLASGGCLVCHDPHSSQYRPLLVSDSDSFCFHCHDRETIEKIPGHADLKQPCTACHDAHMSNSKYLLK
jgi:predicted CXXCH cytochrome family protein